MREQFHGWLRTVVGDVERGRAPQVGSRQRLPRIACGTPVIEKYLELERHVDMCQARVGTAAHGEEVAEIGE